jgi:hypothetical protein
MSWLGGTEAERRAALVFVAALLGGCSGITSGHRLPGANNGGLLPVQANHPSAPVDVKLGDTARTSLGGQVRVITFRSPLASLPGNVVVASAEVRDCAGTQTVSVTKNLPIYAGASPYFFSVQLDDGEIFPAVVGGALAPSVNRPLLAQTRLSADQCAQGWVNFQIPNNRTVKYVIYRSLVTIRWQVA